eukprot:1205715-Amphidinium_carterae.1
MKRRREQMQCGKLFDVTQAKTYTCGAFDIWCVRASMRITQSIMTIKLHFQKVTFQLFKARAQTIDEHEEAHQQKASKYKDITGNTTSLASICGSPHMGIYECAM